MQALSYSETYNHNIQALPSIFRNQRYAPIKNSEGKVIRLNRREQIIANSMQKYCNDLGYEISITSLTTLLKKITEQKFYHLAPAQYIPIQVGEGAWSQFLTSYRSYQIGGKFEDGIVDTGSPNSRYATLDAGVDSLTIPVINWATTIGWSIFDLQLAAKAGNWDLITAKEESRKMNWDLGIQRIAFLGSNMGTSLASANCYGLLNQPNITANTAIITKKISSMTAAELNTFLLGVLEAYRSNSNRTAYPTHFVLPESDYNGLTTQSSADFPIKSKLEVLLDSFKVACANPNFKIMPCSYADAAQSGFSYQIYAMYRYDEKSIRMNIPVDYTSTLANSNNNFNFENIGYGQFTGVLTLRPQELLYFTYSV